MKTLLLDVNVLLALVWPNHPFHTRAVARLSKARQRFATCSLTQAAFIRLSSNPAVIPAAKTPSEAGEMLRLLTSNKRHVWIEAKRNRLAKLQELLRRCQGHNQVNDAFLLWIAATSGTKLLTFDTSFQHLAPAPELVEVIL